MAEAITKDNLFRPVQPGPQTRAEITDAAAWAIMKAEADSREAKSRSLRQSRLEMEARRPKSALAKRRAAKKQ